MGQDDADECEPGHEFVLTGVSFEDDGSWERWECACGALVMQRPDGSERRDAERISPPGG